MNKYVVRNKKQYSYLQKHRKTKVIHLKRNEGKLKKKHLITNEIEKGKFQKMETPIKEGNVSRKKRVES